MKVLAGVALFVITISLFGIVQTIFGNSRILYLLESLYPIGFFAWA